MAKTNTSELPKLTKREQQYFDELKDGVVVSAQFLHTQLHPDADWNSNVVAVHIKNLRKKLVGLYEIEALRGIGYKMQRV